MNAIHVITTAAKRALIFALLAAAACADESPAGPQDPQDVPPPVFDLLHEVTLSGGVQGVRLAVARLDGGADSTVFGMPITGASPTTSADGSVVAYVGPSLDGDDYDVQDLWVVRRGGQPQRFPHTRGMETSPALSPDGTRLAYIRVDSMMHSHLYVADVAGQQETLISFPIAPGLTQAYASPAWSPDGSRLLFSAGEPGRLHLFVVKADGRGLTQLTEGNVTDTEGAWSPDGKQIVYVHTPSPAQSQLVIHTLATGADRTLGYAWRNRTPSWSPDGQRIAFVSNMSDNADLELYTVHPDGSALTRLTSDDVRQQAPRWLRR
jgi:TolB protein